MVELRHMNWFYLALSSTILFCFGNIFAKFILSKYLKNSLFYLFFYLFFLIPFYVVAFIFFVPLSFSNFSLLAILASFFLYLSVYFNYKVYITEEVSRIISLGYTEVIFVLLLSTIFLGEIFTLEKYIGIFLVTIGAISISFKRGLKLRKGVLFILLSSVFFSIYVVLSKYSLNFINFLEFYFWSNLIGLSIIQIPIFFKYKEGFLKTIKGLNKKIFILFLLQGLLNMSVFIFLYLPALSLGKASLVSAVDASRPLFILLITVVLSIFFPYVIKEEIKKSVIFLKLAASFLIILGVFLIA